jgi:hypothetical protein
MSLGALTVEDWRGLDPAAAYGIAGRAAEAARGRLERLDQIEHLGAVLHRLLVERDSRLFSLIPGGQVRLGFDVAAWQPTLEQLDCYREESQSQGYGFHPDLSENLAQLLSPPRTVTVSTVLMAVED